jgi:hypothetical protein
MSRELQPVFIHNSHKCEDIVIKCIMDHIEEKISGRFVGDGNEGQVHDLCE